MNWPPYGDSKADVSNVSHASRNCGLCVKDGKMELRTLLAGAW